MRSRLLPQCTGLAALACAAALCPPSVFAYNVRVCTDRGAIDVDIDEQRAPQQAASFRRLVDSGFYRGTVFHRAVAGGLLQGGTYSRDFERRESGGDVNTPFRPTPVDESFNGLSNRRGTIGASRASDPASASAGFFFNLADNNHLDARANQPGYTVFGRITAGIEVLDEIAALPTRRAGDLDSVPTPLVEIRSVTVVDDSSFFGLTVAPDPLAVRAEIETARARNDPAGILAAIDRLSSACATLDGELYVAEAEAALALGRNDRAHYGLEQFLAGADARDPSLAVARRLYAGLPEAESDRDVGSLIGHCRRPVAPSVPQGPFVERASLEAVEPALVRYRQLGEQYLACVGQVIEDGGLNPAETAAVAVAHNEVVLDVTAATIRFNQAVRGLQRGPQGFSEPLAPR